MWTTHSDDDAPYFRDADGKRIYGLFTHEDFPSPEEREREEYYAKLGFYLFFGIPALFIYFIYIFG